jgi:hypothetical protein
MDDQLEMPVAVHRQWNDWRMASYRLRDVSGLHWSNESGGVNATSPQFFVHGYVWCDRKFGPIATRSTRSSASPHRYCPRSRSWSRCLRPWASLSRSCASGVSPTDSRSCRFRPRRTERSE